jgi:hypothetical protein
MVIAVGGWDPQRRRPDTASRTSQARPLSELLGIDGS